MKSSTTRWGRGVAAAVSGALFLGSAAALAAPAQAATVPALGAPAQLEWKISQTFVNHLYYGMTYNHANPGTPNGTATGGAEFHEGVIGTAGDETFTFPAASVEKKDGKTIRRYSGTVRGEFAMMGKSYYSVVVSNPVVTIDADGDGSIAATVSSKVNAQPAGTDPRTGAPTAATPEENSGPTAATVVEFEDAVVTGTTTKATPNWAGVLPAADQAARDLGLPVSQPKDGNSFSADFLGALLPSTRAHFHDSTSNSADKKPGVATLSTTPFIVPTITKNDQATGVEVELKGYDFSAATLEGDKGVYVVVLPQGSAINYEDRAGTLSASLLNRYVGAAGTPGINAQIVDGAFVTSGLIPASKVTPRTNYAVSTWQAHVHSNTSQDTTTALAIDWSAWKVTPKPAPKKSSKITAKVSKKATKKKTGKVSISVAGGSTKATGKVKVVIKAPGKKTITKKVTLKRGKASVALTKAKKKGTYKLSVSYSGDKKLKAAKKKYVSFKVKK